MRPAAIVLMGRTMKVLHLCPLWFPISRNAAAYVSTCSGWFSDRTVAYLASGRPAVVQDTGFSRFLPCGQGLLGFRSPAEARAAIRTLAGDLERHARAARAIVEEHFDATRVLTALLESSL